jgi:dienelactone hydrolase
MSRIIRRLLLLAILAACLPWPARAGSDIGIVLLHGTSGIPNSRIMTPFTQAMRGAGYLVLEPEMCWSRTRIYGGLYLDCLREIDGAIASLRSQGARHIVLAGQSAGGNAVLVYASTHPGLLGVIALAPAANPAGLLRNPATAQSYAQAQQMIAAGHGNDRATFTSVNNGTPFATTSTAAAFASFHDPQGPAAFPNALPHVTEPVLWVAGNADQSQASADTWFATLPANRLNRIVHVSSDHLGTPAAGATAALDWLKTLPAK